jgi:hypothetical protein
MTRVPRADGRHPQSRVESAREMRATGAGWFILAISTAEIVLWPMQDATMLSLVARAAIAPGTISIAMKVAALAGRQPLGLTSEWPARNRIPADWQRQRQRIAAL